MKLFTEHKEFTDNEGKLVVFEQVYLEEQGIVVPIKPVFKSDRRLLLLLAGRKEN